jgi:hypothetical protein
VVALEGVGKIAGNVMAVAVRHEISKGNWYTDIQFGQSRNGSSKWKLMINLLHQ